MQYSQNSWIDPRIEVHPSRIQGQGMFATAPIQTGEVVIVWGGTLFTGEEIRQGKARPLSIAAIDEDLYLADPADSTDSPDYYLNHSCDPNLWMADEVTLVARRNIQPGEELTADYILWEADPDWVLEPCRCGSALCRGKVSGADWQLAELQGRYSGHFMPYINRRIDRLRDSRGL